MPLTTLTASSFRKDKSVPFSLLKIMYVVKANKGELNKEMDVFIYLPRYFLKSVKTVCSVVLLSLVVPVGTSAAEMTHYILSGLYIYVQSGC